LAHPLKLFTSADLAQAAGISRAAVSQQITRIYVRVFVDSISQPNSYCATWARARCLEGSVNATVLNASLIEGSVWTAGLRECLLNSGELEIGTVNYAVVVFS
jgi:hypothetical protein